MTANGRTLLEMAKSLESRSKTLINADLKKICKEEGEIQSGNKSQLQQRVMAIIQRYVDSNDIESLQRLRYRISNHGDAPPPGYVPSPAPAYPTPAASAAPSAFAMPNNQIGRFAPLPPVTGQHLPSGTQRFKDSPFYDILDSLLPPTFLETTPQHRLQKEIALNVPQDMCNRLRADSTLRLMLFCSIADSGLSLYERADIAFPPQIEVKLNNEEVKSNYKGLKNKPGSTRPVDITSFVRKQHQTKNRLVITYALTQKRFSVFVFLVKKHTVPELVNRIQSRGHITKQSVIQDMMKKADDPDIVFDSIVMSLKDPISTLRINVPCRSHICTHNQCFDAESFLQLQEQAPTWQCPVCNKTVSFEGLAVDQYFQEILNTVPKGTDQVTIEPNGNWTYGGRDENQTPRNGKATHHDAGSDDDLIEISDYRVTNIKAESRSTPLSATRTPPLSSRDSSTAPRTGSKRTSEVIDLTLSDDDEPPRPAKKVAYNTPNSLPDSSFRHRVPTFGNPAPTPPPPSFQPPPQLQSHLPHPMPGQLRMDRLDIRPPVNAQNAPVYPGYRTAPRAGYGPGGYSNLGSAS